MRRRFGWVTLGPVHGLSRCFWLTVCLTYVALALLYNALTPIGESPDETAHFQYLRLLTDERRLPGVGDNFWQGHQAPLYYVAGATWSEVIRVLSGCQVDRGQLPTRITPGFPQSQNFNWLVHAPPERFTSWGCHEWSYHLLRLLSTAFTVPMILLTFGILRQALPGSPTTVAVGGMLTALLPSHVALSAMLNNDALVNLLIVATTYLVGRACQRGEPADLTKAAVLACVAAMAKLSSVYLFGLILVAPVLRRDLRTGFLRSGRRRAWLAAAGACSLLPLFVLMRNMKQWGDPFAATALEKNLALLITAGVMPPSAGLLRYYTVELPQLFAGAFAVAYGAVNFSYGDYLRVAKWVPRLLTASVLLSLFVRGVWHRVERRPFIVLGVGFLLFFLTYFYPGYRYRWLQVRYFFNQLPVISLVAAVGLQTVWEFVRKLGLGGSDRVFVAVVYACLVGLNILVLWGGVITHLYRHVGASG